MKWFVYFLIASVVLWEMALPILYRKTLTGFSIRRVHYSEQQPLSLKWSQRTFTFPVFLKLRHSTTLVRSILEKPRCNIGSNEDGSTQPARVLLEKLFVQSQKLGEQMSIQRGIEVDISLELLEADLRAALVALVKKEQDLRHAERLVLLDCSELNHARRELELREKEMAAAEARRIELEEEHKKAHIELTSQARQIEELTLLIRDSDKELLTTKSDLSQKEAELDKLKNDLNFKDKEVANVRLELQSRDQILIHANDVIQKQEAELQELHSVIRERELNLLESLQQRQNEEENLKIAEAKLEQRTLEWLSMQEELKKLTEEAAKQKVRTRETIIELDRVRTLLANVKVELMDSQKSLALSRKKLNNQEHQLQKHLADVVDQKLILMSHRVSLNDAQTEIESQSDKLEEAQSRNAELEKQLNAENELVQKLQFELDAKKSALAHSSMEVLSLKKELEEKNSEFRKAQNLLQAKESDLIKSKLEIQHFKSEQKSIQLILEEKDAIIRTTEKKLEDMKKEVSELKNMMKEKEDALLLVTAKLQDKEQDIQLIQLELDGTKLKYSEAASIVHRIAMLTHMLVVSAKNQSADTLAFEVGEMQLTRKHMNVLPTTDQSIELVSRQKQLGTEVETTKETLRLKEVEMLAVKRNLALKEEELKAVVAKWESNERELEKMMEEFYEEAENIKRMHALAQERIGDKTVSDLAIERLQVEVDPLEIEAAVSALQALENLSQQLLKETKTCLSFEIDPDCALEHRNEVPRDDINADTSLGQRNGVSRGMTLVKGQKNFEKKIEAIVRLSALTTVSGRGSH